MLNFNILTQYYKGRYIIKDSIWLLTKFPDAWSEDITAPSANMGWLNFLVVC